MKKKVGKIFGICFLYFVMMQSSLLFASQASISLRMLDMNHKPIDQAMREAPFILQVELKNLDGYTDKGLMQYLTGIENFKSSRSMTSHDVSINNGKKTTKSFYDFVVRSDKNGNFTVGPLVLKDSSGQIIKSNRLIIPIGDKVLSSDKNHKEKHFLQASLDKKQAYIGEKIRLTIQFYDRLLVDDLHLNFPDFQNVYMVKNKNNIKKSMIDIDGQEYSLTEWFFDIYAQQAGSLIIQDIQAAFFAPELGNRFKFGGAFDFFRSLHKTEHYIVAQPVKAEILPLPENAQQHDVQAVGQFSKFSIKIDHDIASVGQGIVLTTELFGHANFEIMDEISLMLPEGFNYYDSRLVTIDDQRSYKKSEFIIQASAPGTYKIKPQVLVYFDPADARYKKIKSNACDIVITPVAQDVQDSHVLPDQEQVSGEQLFESLKNYCAIEKNSLHAPLQPMIPLQRYKQLLYLLFSIWFLLYFYRAGWQKYFFKHKKLHTFIIFLQAKKACKAARAQRDAARLYAIFIQIFVQLLKVNAGQLDETAILTYLKNKEFSDEQIQTWKHFYYYILQASFSSEIIIKKDDIFEQALQWIQQLKERS